MTENVTAEVVEVEVDEVLEDLMQAESAEGGQKKVQPAGGPGVSAICTTFRKFPWKSVVEGDDGLAQPGLCTHLKEPVGSLRRMVMVQKKGYRSLADGATQAEHNKAVSMTWGRWVAIIRDSLPKTAEGNYEAYSRADKPMRCVITPGFSDYDTADENGHKIRDYTYKYADSMEILSILREVPCAESDTGWRKVGLNEEVKLPADPNLWVGLA